MNLKLASIANYLAALILLAFGVIYLFKHSFMAYHSEALSMDWNEVGRGTQFLILALMRGVSGGFIATAIVVIILQKKFSSTKIPWIPWLILIAGLIVSAASIYATLIVRLNSPGRPPTFLAIIGTILLLTGFVFNQKSLSMHS